MQEGAGNGRVAAQLQGAQMPGADRPPTPSRAGYTEEGTGLPNPWVALPRLGQPHLGLQNHSLPEKMISLGQLSPQELPPESGDWRQKRARKA